MLPSRSSTIGIGGTWAGSAEGQVMSDSIDAMNLQRAQALQAPSSSSSTPRQRSDVPSELQTSKKVFTFYTHKGGVGKTTCLSHMAIKAVKEGKNVLVVDCDPQMNSTSFFFRYCDNNLDFDAFYEALVRYHTTVLKPQPSLSDQDKEYLAVYGEKSKNIWDLIREVDTNEGFQRSFEAHASIGIEIGTTGPGSLRLVASHPMFGEIETSIAAELNDPYRRVDYSTRFRRAINFIIEKYHIDLVFVDLSPSSSFLNQNIILSSDFIILPCSADEFAYYSIRTVGMWLAAWRLRHQILHPLPKILTVVYNKYKRYTSPDQGVTSQIQIRDKIFNTSSPHVAYIRRLIDQGGAIDKLVEQNPAFVLPWMNYREMPLICDGLSTMSNLSVLRRTSYDPPTSDYTSNDKNTRKQLEQEYNFLWEKIASTFFDHEVAMAE